MAEKSDVVVAGHISTEEAKELIQFLNQKMGTGKTPPKRARLSFYPGVSYRHLLIIRPEGSLEHSLLVLKLERDNIDSLLKMVHIQ